MTFLCDNHSITWPSHVITTLAITWHSSDNICGQNGSKSIYVATCLKFQKCPCSFTNYICVYIYIYIHNYLAKSMKLLNLRPGEGLMKCQIHYSISSLLWHFIFNYNIHISHLWRSSSFSCLWFWYNLSWWRKTGTYMYMYM